MPSKRIYLDNNAATALAPEVSNLIIDTLPNLQGNPSSIHKPGQIIRGLIAKARAEIASHLKVNSTEIIFTSGGTESVNTALRGLIYGKKTGHILTSVVEHPCVIETCKQLESEGHEVTYLPVGLHGAVLPEAVRKALRPDTQLIALMAANNETGVETDVESISKIALERKIPFFVDAVSWLGKAKVKIPQGVSAMAFSGHKIHALQGIGLLYLRSGVKLHPLLVGGEQEYGRRAGTENVLGIISFAKAISLITSESIEEIRRLRDLFEKTLQEAIPGLLINGEGSRIANTSNLSFPGIDGESLLMHLDREGIAVSHGSACSSGSLEPSRILLGMDLPLERVNASIRFSLSRLTTQAEIEKACSVIINYVGLCNKS